MREYRRDYNEKNRGRRQDRMAKRRAVARAYVDEYKSKPCADCGASWPPVAMDLDHVRDAKFKSVAMMVSQGYKVELIAIEVAKCDVVCACCHRIRTSSRGENLAPNMKEVHRRRTGRNGPINVDWANS